MHRYRNPAPSQEQQAFAAPMKTERQSETVSAVRGDRFDRHRSHHREHLFHDIRCQEADQEIREMLRRY